MSQKNKLEKIVYSHVLSSIVCDLGEIPSYYHAHEYLQKCVANNESHDELTIWQHLEDLPTPDLLEVVEDEFVSLLNTMRDVLELAEKGLVVLAENGGLDSDANSIDLESMIELGHDSSMNELESQVLTIDGIGIYELPNGNHAVADAIGGPEGFYLELGDREILIREAYNHLIVGNSYEEQS